MPQMAEQAPLSCLLNCAVVLDPLAPYPHTNDSSQGYGVREGPPWSC